MTVLEQPLTDGELSRLERDTFKYFADEVNLENGLIPDNTRTGAPASIAAVGFALTAYPIAVERKYLTRADAVRRTLATLRFFYDCPQGKEPDATGYKGFYYHFLDMKTGRRAAKCEISTNWQLLTSNVRSNHVHVVVAADRDPELVLIAFKANATRQLREDRLWLHDFSPWARKGSKIRLWNEQSIARAIDYVLHGQGDDLPDFD